MNHTYLLADDGRGVDSGEGEVHVGGDHGGVVLVLRLEAAGLGSSSRSKLGVQADLQSGHQLGKVRLVSFSTQEMLLLTLSTTSTVVLRLLSVVHFSVRVIPRSFT